MTARPGVKCRSSSSRAAATSVPGSASSCSSPGRRRPTALRPASHGPRSGASGPISAPEPSRRSQISRSRCTNGIAARCRPADELATGGPKSLISALTGSSASAYAVAVLPVAANRPNSHSSSSGLCGARTLPTDARRNRASRSRNSSRVTPCLPNRLPDMTAQPRKGPTSRAQRRPLPPSPAHILPPDDQGLATLSGRPGL